MNNYAYMPLCVGVGGWVGGCGCVGVGGWVGGWMGVGVWVGGWVGEWVCVYWGRTSDNKWPKTEP